MDWLACIRDALDYMEAHLTEIRSPDEVAAHMHVSCMHLQNGFRVVTGYTLGEYMRNRRLYLAALELVSGREPVIGVALKYGYETPASFDKAFARFHGATPLEVRKGRHGIRTFLRLNVCVSVRGGESMEFRIERKESITVVGFERVFCEEDSYEKIPLFWDEMTARYAPRLMQGLPPEGEAEEYVAAHRIGELGVCTDDLPGGRFHYMIAGYFDGGPVPEGMTVRRIEAGEWAVFPCTLATLQDTNTAVWKEWLPENGGYVLTGRYNIEWYSGDGDHGPAQRCEIRLPVKRK